MKHLLLLKAYVAKLSTIGDGSSLKSFVAEGKNSSASYDLSNTVKTTFVLIVLWINH